MSTSLFDRPSSRSHELVANETPLAILQVIAQETEESEILLGLLRAGRLYQNGDEVELWVPKSKIDWDHFEQSNGTYKVKFVPKNNLREGIAETRQRFFDEYQSRHSRKQED